MIGILDYGMGNIHSVFSALDYLGHDVKVVSHANDIVNLSHLVIPGVGAYASAMKNMHRMKLIDAVMAHSLANKPLLGICLGMQILSNNGIEGGDTKGLGLIPGNVLHLPDECKPIPHVGWNNLVFNKQHPVFSGVKTHVDYYFVHSYFFDPLESNDLLASTENGISIPSVVAKNNIIGMQFHPEKSQDNGLLLLDNFCDWDGVC